MMRNVWAPCERRNPKSPGEITQGGLDTSSWVARNRSGNIINHSRNCIVRNAVGLLAVSTIFAATPGLAAPRYDGIWSVAIVTKTGDCVTPLKQII